MIYTLSDWLGIYYTLESGLKKKCPVLLRNSWMRVDGSSIRKEKKSCGFKNIQLVVNGPLVCLNCPRQSYLPLCYSIDYYGFRIDLLKTGFTLALKVIRQLCIYLGLGFTTV